MSDDKLKYSERFKSIYAEHFYKVKYFAVQYLGDEDEAENVAQEVFVSFWENIEKIDFNKNILAYLLTSARNKSLNVISKESYHKRYMNDSIKSHQRKINYRLLKENVTSNVLKREIEAILVEAFKEMPENVRETFIICKLKGFKQREAAGMLGVSEKTIEQRMKKAMVILRKEFKEYLPFFLLFFEFGLYIYNRL